MSIRLISKSFRVDSNGRLLINKAAGRTDGIQVNGLLDITAITCIPYGDGIVLSDRKYALTFDYSGPDYIGPSGVTKDTGYRMQPGRTAAQHDAPRLSATSNRKQFLRNSYLWIAVNESVEICAALPATVEGINSLEVS